GRAKHDGIVGAKSRKQRLLEGISFIKAPELHLQRSVQHFRSPAKVQNWVAQFLGSKPATCRRGVQLLREHWCNEQFTSV
ncbi:hypothetical protein M514_06391, partial [Trichuris suis]